MLCNKPDDAKFTIGPYLFVLLNNIVITTMINKIEGMNEITGFGEGCRY